MPTTRYWLLLMIGDGGVGTAHKAWGERKWRAVAAPEYAAFAQRMVTGRVGPQGDREPRTRGCGRFTGDSPPRFNYGEICPACVGVFSTREMALAYLKEDILGEGAFERLEWDDLRPGHTVVIGYGEGEDVYVVKAFEIDKRTLLGQ